MAEVIDSGKIKTANVTPNTKTNTGVKVPGLYKLQIGSLDYGNPLYFILTDSGQFVTKLNTTWYSESINMVFEDGSLYINYSTNNNALLYFTLLK